MNRCRVHQRQPDHGNHHHNHRPASVDCHQHHYCRPDCGEHHHHHWSNGPSNCCEPRHHHQSGSHHHQSEIREEWQLCGICPCCRGVRPEEVDEPEEEVVVQPRPIILPVPVVKPRPINPPVPVIQPRPITPTIPVEPQKPPPASLPSWTLEISAEVGKIRLGGINTCLRTKAAKAVEKLGDSYVLIGPLSSETNLDVELDQNCKPPLALIKATDKMRIKGYQVQMGRWKVPGRPLVVLLGADPLQKSSLSTKYIQEIRQLADVNINIPADDAEAEEAVIFSYLAAEFLCQLNTVAVQEPKRPIVAHFHDWMTGLGILLLKEWKVLDTFSTIYAAHSTVFGRHLSAADGGLYRRLSEHFHHRKGEEAVKSDFVFYHRHKIEMMAVKLAGVLTTVSSIATEETRCLLGRKPDVMTFNGLSIVDAQLANQKHRENRAKIDTFVRHHFAGQDLGVDPVYLFSAGRCEFHNKGVDFLIASLAHLKYELERTKRTVVIFLFYPADCKGRNWDTVQRQKDGIRLEQLVAMFELKYGRKVYDGATIPRRLPFEYGATWDDQDARLLDEAISNVRTFTLDEPPISTHHPVAGSSDPILGSLQFHRLANGDSERVKVVYCPQFNGDSEVMTYQDMISGCDLGVFPSRYSWGYTPAECAIAGTPSVVSQSSGFGQFSNEFNGQGIFILPQRTEDDKETVRKVAESVLNFVQLDQSAKDFQRSRALAVGAKLDWDGLIANYQKAWNWIKESPAQGAESPPQDAGPIKPMEEKKKKIPKILKPAFNLFKRIVRDAIASTKRAGQWVKIKTSGISKEDPDEQKK